MCNTENNQIFEQQQQFQMRNRYFSPDQSSSYYSHKQTESAKLRWVGSIKKLPALEKSSESQNIRIIGGYAYKFQKQIGSGYSSKVYKAVRVFSTDQNIKISQQTETKQKRQQYYAIKVIELKKYSASNMQMLQNQIKILKSLEHPNIIRFFHMQKTSKNCYIVTEFCQNGDLLQYLTRKGSFSEQEASRIMKDIVQGYKHLISKGIIHRDLKPANILRSKDGWKIADFGFSIQSESDITSKQNVGTPLYMPIQSLKKNVYSVKSDIFAIGVIYYELLVGRTPWECKSENQLVKKMTFSPFAFPERVRNLINQKIQTVIKNICAVQYSKRMGKSEFMELSIQSILNPEEYEPDLIKQNSSQQNNYVIKPTTLAKKVTDYYCKKPEDSIGSIGQNNNDQNQRQNNLIIKWKSTEKLIKIDRKQDKLNMAKINSFNSKLSTSDDQKRGQDKSFTTNDNILVNQLYFCRFMYYMVKNAGVFKLSQFNKDKLCLVIFKHIIKHIKLLSDRNRNWFNLENWDLFKHTSKFQSTRETMKYYLIRYERQYLSFLKKMEINTIRDVNRQLNGFSSNQHLTQAFYQQILDFISPLMRQYNHNLSQTLHESLYLLTDQLKGSIHGLHSLNKYCQLIKLYYNKGQMDFEGFQKKSQIKVHIDYRYAPSHCTLEDYVALRKQLKNT